MPILGKGGFRTLFYLFILGILEVLELGETSFLSKHFDTLGIVLAHISRIWYTSRSVGVGG